MDLRCCFICPLLFRCQMLSYQWKMYTHSSMMVCFHTAEINLMALLILYLLLCGPH